MIKQLLQTAHSLYAREECGRKDKVKEKRQRTDEVQHNRRNSEEYKKHSLRFHHGSCLPILLKFNFSLVDPGGGVAKTNQECQISLK